MLSLKKAQYLIWKNTEILPVEKISLENSLGRISGEDVFSDFDIPPFNRAAMDGFALNSKDTKKASEKSPVILQVSGEVKAGDKKVGKYKKGKCFSIMTGSLIPDGCDAVVMFEEVQEVSKGKKKFIKIFRRVKKGENISKKGEDIKKGNKVIKKGTVINSSILGMISYLGKKEIYVYRKPKISILSTGNEVKKPGRKIKNGEIYDANGYLLYGLCLKNGAEVNYLGIARDRKKILQGYIKKGLQSDILIISGGVSEGRYDLVAEVLKENGVKKIFWKVAIKPGKPTFFGKKGKILVFGLPGYPVSSFINFENLVKFAIYKMAGRKKPERVKISGILLEDIKNKGDRDTFYRVNFFEKDGNMYILPYPSQKSGVLSSIIEANALLLLKKGEEVRKGEKVVVEIFEK